MKKMLLTEIFDMEDHDDEFSRRPGSFRNFPMDEQLMDEVKSRLTQEIQKLEQQKRPYQHAMEQVAKFEAMFGGGKQVKESILQRNWIRLSKILEPLIGIG